MNKGSLNKEMNKRLNEKMFISKNKLRAITGFGEAMAYELLKDLPFVEVGTVKKYFVPDVNERIMERMRG